MQETFQQHMTAELTGDIKATMDTMTDNPHVNHVPVMTGGIGCEGVRQFYHNHLVGKFFPPDVEIVTDSRPSAQINLWTRWFSSSPTPCPLIGCFQGSRLRANVLK
jgi:hypothetical protein